MIRMDENTIRDGADIVRPLDNPGLKNKDHPVILRGSETSYPYLQVALLHGVPYSWVLQFADRLEHAWDEELPHKITWSGWQVETHLALKSEHRRRKAVLARGW